MIAVVIDANVFISALVFGGVPRTVIQLSQREGWQVWISRAIMDEVAETLAEKFDWTKAELDFALPPLWERCHQIESAIRLNVCVDDDDNRVLECAKASGAKLVITEITTSSASNGLRTSLLLRHVLSSISMSSNFG